MKKLLIPALLLSCVFVGSEIEARGCRSCKKRQCSTCSTKRGCTSCSKKTGCTTCTNGACSIVAARNVAK
jgi:hypothetical protein